MKTLTEVLDYINKLSQDDYALFIKGIIAYELELYDEEVLDDMYNKFMNDNTNASILSERFADYYNEIITENKNK